MVAFPPQYWQLASFHASMKSRSIDSAILDAASKQIAHMDCDFFEPK
jgi:hypothetical protein